MYNSYSQLCEEASRLGGLVQAVLHNEMTNSGKSENEIYTELFHRWNVMKDSAQKALETPQPMVGNLISGTALKQQQFAQKDKGMCGSLLNLAMASALSASEVNASMGKICAAPTAGACGVLPASLLAAAVKFHVGERVLCDALLVAAGIGAIITRNATVSGAEGGCQAECGAAAAMAAAAVVNMAGGDTKMVGSAISIALMNCMGLVCDPVAGLVQLPCAFRNASQVLNAMLSADLALAGQDPLIPTDEVIDSMGRVGRSLPTTLRETSLGGIATTPTARRISSELNLNAEWD